MTREAALFDTGWDAAPIFKEIDDNKAELKHLFLTHTHEDHIAALADVRQRFPKVKLHSSSKSAPPEQRNRANDFTHLGSLRITNRDTPGHAEDGVTYIIGNFPDDAANVAVVGDCIFAGSIGRGFQSTELLKQKIREQIFSLQPDTLICSRAWAPHNRGAGKGKQSISLTRQCRKKCCFAEINLTGIAQFKRRR